jgi:hypothetical protein
MAPDSYRWDDDVSCLIKEGGGARGPEGFWCDVAWVDATYLFGDKYLFSILPKQQHARSDFCLIVCMVARGRVGK